MQLTLRVLAFTSLLGMYSSAFSQDAKTLYQRSAPSVVALVMSDRSGQPLSLGSGFVLRDNLVATNFHVIRGAASGSAKLIGSKGVYTITGVVAKDRVPDLAILRVEGLVAPALTLSQNAAPAIGESVYAIGNPQGLEGTLSQGIVSGIRSVGSTYLIQITAPISPGSSGGPVLGDHGKVIGVAVSTMKTGQNLNFAVAIRHVEELLKDAGSIETLVQVANTQSTPKKAAPAPIERPGIEKVSSTSINCAQEYGVGSWKCNFSVRNLLEIPIRNVRYVAIIYDKQGQQLDTWDSRVAAYQGAEVKPGLALRTSSLDGEFVIEDSTKRLVGRIDVRILGFDSAQ